MRVNRGDYCIVTENTVYNTTWWSSNAESAIVFAETTSIDTEDKIKMTITNNMVYENMNKVPFHISTPLMRQIISVTAD